MLFTKMKSLFLTRGSGISLSFVGSAHHFQRSTMYVSSLYFRTFSTATASTPSLSPSSATDSSSSSSSSSSAAYVYYGPSSYANKPLKSPPRRDIAMKLRVAKIQEGLANQTKVIKDYQKQKPVRPLKQGLLQYIKKNAWEKD